MRNVRTRWRLHHLFRLDQMFLRVLGLVALRILDRVSIHNLAQKLMIFILISQNKVNLLARLARRRLIKPGILYLLICWSLRAGRLQRARAHQSILIRIRARLSRIPDNLRLRERVAPRCVLGLDEAGDAAGALRLLYQQDIVLRFIRRRDPTMPLLLISPLLHVFLNLPLRLAVPRLVRLAPHRLGRLVRLRLELTLRIQI